MRKVLVAMSGGVDSSTAAFLLTKQGYDIAGAFMHLFVPRECADQGTPSCCSRQSREDARAVAEQIGIDFHVFDFQEEFQRDVVDYFKDAYLRAKTPNPCIICNEKIKFGLFLQRARELGFDGIATGHYAVCTYDTGRRKYLLREAADTAKDQSYFLFSLTQEQLAHTVFPVSGYTKRDIKAVAERERFFAKPKPESQETCFIPDRDYVTFFKNEYRIQDTEGVIRDTGGNVRGRHRGYFYFTIGQRRGLGVAASRPLYVVSIDKDKNEVIVGTKEEVMRRRFRVVKLHWTFWENIPGDVTAQVRVRYNQPKAPARITVEGSSADVEFIDFEDAIAPGQAAVFYDGDIVLGGGWIA